MTCVRHSTVCSCLTSSRSSMDSISPVPSRSSSPRCVSARPMDDIAFTAIAYRPAVDAEENTLAPARLARGRRNPSTPISPAPFAGFDALQALLQKRFAPPANCCAPPMTRMTTTPAIPRCRKRPISICSISRQSALNRSTAAICMPSSTTSIRSGTHRAPRPTRSPRMKMSSAS